MVVRDFLLTSTKRKRRGSDWGFTGIRLPPGRSGAVEFRRRRSEFTFSKQGSRKREGGGGRERERQRGGGGEEEREEEGEQERRTEERGRELNVERGLARELQCESRENNINFGLNRC